jgi:hypothetical protein
MLVRMTEKAMHNCVSTFEEILALAGMVWYGMVWYGMPVGKFPLLLPPGGSVAPPRPCVSR